MACYKCGGMDGDEAKLCPKCTQERLNEFKVKAQQESPRGKEVLNMESPWDRLEFLLQLPIVKLMLGLSVALVALYYVLFSRIGPGLGYAPADRVYFSCMEKVAKRGTFNIINLKNNKSPMARELEQSMEKNMGEVICKMAKDACQKDKSFCSINY